MKTCNDRVSSPPRRLTACGETRREFLWEAGGGFAGTALTYLLASEGFFDRLARAGDLPRNESPLASKPPHLPARAKACIVLFMYGGPSQVDLFDPKPELARRHGTPIPNLDKDPLFKMRGP